MAFKDILLTLTSYPDPTPVSVAEEAVSIAASLACFARMQGREPVCPAQDQHHHRDQDRAESLRSRDAG